MKSIKIVMVALLVIAVGACTTNYPEQNESRGANTAIIIAEEEMELSAQDEPPQYSPSEYISSSAAMENPNDSTRKMIRTANIRFKVNDVIQATYMIENIVVNNSGFVEKSDLTSRINNTKTTTIKKDSTLVTTYYTVLNSLILRVPNTKLDATLKEIAQLIDFMDFRIIEAKDVTLDLLSKKMEQIRLEQFESRMVNAIDSKGKRLNDVTGAEESLLRKQQQADEAKLANLQILDKINFSTITLSLYQNQSIKYDVIVKEQKIKPYTTPFGVRFVEALKFGWVMLESICLFFVDIWPVVLIAVLAFFGVKYFKKRKK